MQTDTSTASSRACRLRAYIEFNQMTELLRPKVVPISLKVWLFYNVFARASLNAKFVVEMIG